MHWGKIIASIKQQLFFLNSSGVNLELIHECDKVGYGRRPRPPRRTIHRRAPLQRGPSRRHHLWMRTAVERARRPTSQVTKMRDSPPISTADALQMVHVVNIEGLL